MGDNQRDTKSCMGNSGQECAECQDTGIFSFPANGGLPVLCTKCRHVKPADLSDPAQLRKLLFDEWRCSSPIFGGDPGLLEEMEKPPWNRTLPQLILLAAQSWWAYGVKQTPGMAAIAAYVRGD